MRRTWLRVISLFVLGVVTPSSARLDAQDRPVVFIHGVASGPETWEDAAARLQSSLQIAPERPAVTWRNSVESQGSEVQGALGGLSGSTVAVGHSLGGIVSRQWSRQHQLDGVITLGAPNRGAPIANHIKSGQASTRRCSARSGTRSTS